MNTQETENVWNFLNDGLSLLKPEKLKKSEQATSKVLHKKKEFILNTFTKVSMHQKD